ncbi:hypothetical protein GMOD_00003862 [Pyrenophora seminiperda CCB06]|uniref:Uncharacterized protein n=1 Tax=Pyrenophora seminiperda CCB06 TaxID=1302712 RepID=A0A3M7M083_9PLEO|nr:hypothetical protein GMOD_00003862 [Pyrenophora seminiperda CCB06]
MKSGTRSKLKFLRFFSNVPIIDGSKTWINKLSYLGRKRRCGADDTSSGVTVSGIEV